MIWAAVVAVAGLGLWVVLLVWAVRQIGEAIAKAFEGAAEAGTRATFGVVPVSEPAEDGKASVVSHDGFEDHLFAQEQVITPQDRERMLARLAPWDHEEGNPFE